jgi:hypothetical protein
MLEILNCIRKRYLRCVWSVQITSIIPHTALTGLSNTAKTRVLCQERFSSQDCDSVALFYTAFLYSVLREQGNTDAFRLGESAMIMLYSLHWYVMLQVSHAITVNRKLLVRVGNVFC